MRRRALLSSLAALTGCSAGPETPDAGPEPTDTPDAEPIPAGSVVRRPAIRYYRNDDAIAVERPRHDQFAFVYVEGSLAERGAYNLRLSDREFDVLEPRGFSLSVPVTGDYYEHGQGWLVFDVPAVAPDDAALVRDGAERPLAAETLDGFGVTADLTVRSVSVPERVAPGEDVVASIEVANEGDREGVFLGGIRKGGYPRSLSARVPVGGSTTVTGRLPTYDGEEVVRLVVSLPGDDQSFEVDVAATPTATTANE